jgi:hypothetical protein
MRVAEAFLCHYCARFIDFSKNIASEKPVKRRSPVLAWLARAPVAALKHLLQRLS